MGGRSAFLLNSPHLIDSNIHNTLYEAQEGKLVSFGLDVVVPRRILGTMTVFTDAGFARVEFCVPALYFV